MCIYRIRSEAILSPEPVTGVAANGDKCAQARIVDPINVQVRHDHRYGGRGSTAALCIRPYRHCCP